MLDGFYDFLPLTSTLIIPLISPEVTDNIDTGCEMKMQNQKETYQ